MERLEMACHRAGRSEDASDARRTLLGMRRAFERVERLAAAIEKDGWEVARSSDLRSELAAHLAAAESSDAFRD